MSPEPSAPAWFDRHAGAWVLSRYADVLAAFRHPQLWTIAGSGKDQMEIRDDSGRLAARAEMQESLAYARVAEWQERFEPSVCGVLAGLPRDRTVDLLAEFARPCCLQLAAMITGVAQQDVGRLGQLGAEAFGGTGALPGSVEEERAKAATEEMNRYFAGARFRMGEPTFVGTSQTMARLLANGWLALLRNPPERDRLRAQRELMPTAVEELLRYAGIVPTLYRRAYEDAAIGAAQIVKGQRVHLRIAAANRDPEQFAEPDRLDIGRRAVNHLALGIGRNSCVGNVVIRMASAATLRALLELCPAARLAGEAKWQTTPSFSWPRTVPVLLG